jgi:hypothetical protein
MARGVSICRWSLRDDAQLRHGVNVVLKGPLSLDEPVSSAILRTGPVPTTVGVGVSYVRASDASAQQTNRRFSHVSGNTRSFTMP